ncbi:MAG: methionyl-tRNA formyltransferase [Alphaproteobacteria bacterium]|nr:methionyl-tRNA formyltransferase [Alphaproteobacteria bacterium]
MKVVFMGTPDFCVPVLENLVKHHEVVCVYTQPPRPAGKGYQLRPTPIHEKAEELGIPVRHPVSLKQVGEQVEFFELGADVAVVCAYGLILPQAILDAPKYGCINIHASLLPRWRGAAPIQRSIQSGDSKTGITIMQMDAGLDTGDMLMTGEIPITDCTDTPTLHDALSQMGADLIIKTLADLDYIKPVAQPSEGATYAEKLQKSEALIDWTLPAVQIDRNVRALKPVPGTYFVYKDERIKVLDACVSSEEAKEAPAGTVISEMPLMIACGEGVLKLNRLQREGKKPMAVEDFQKGYTIKAGEKLAL